MYDTVSEIALQNANYKRASRPPKYFEIKFLNSNRSKDDEEYEHKKHLLPKLLKMGISETEARRRLGLTR